MYVYIYVCIIYVYMCMYIYLCMYIYIIYVYVYIYICICVSEGEFCGRRRCSGGRLLLFLRYDSQLRDFALFPPPTSSRRSRPLQVELCVFIRGSLFFFSWDASHLLKINLRLHRKLGLVSGKTSKLLLPPAAQRFLVEEAFTTHHRSKFKQPDDTWPNNRVSTLFQLTGRC